MSQQNPAGHRETDSRWQQYLGSENEEEDEKRRKDDKTGIELKMVNYRTV